MSESTSSRPRSWISHSRTDRLISTSWRSAVLASGSWNSSWVIRHSSAIVSRLDGDLARQLLGLLEVAGGAAEQEAEDEDLGADGAGEQRAELEQVDVGQLDDQLDAEDESHPGSGGDEQPRVAPEQVSGHDGRA